MLVPLYIAALACLMLASAVWRYRERDMIGMATCLPMGAWVSTFCIAGAFFGRGVSDL
ncbi:hypothetical protein [Mesorhizobium sp. 131-2-1]|uniref:hypothetical protein n=1 Tax=Mesorhizobium sp. 131-2-1 TaxID=2744518 RepID=UPI001927F8B6|nr:hypothetical protein [Mesorhizobium sp. 131-2-1]BCG92280.1 hypothetical protein MesoLj131a_11440 [Mesorhizobium sp. 131-2-1]